MEIIQVQNNSTNKESGLKINDLTKYYLTATHKWTKFLAIMSFGVGIIFVCALILIILNIPMPANGGVLSSRMIGFIYLVACGMIIPPAVFQNNFSNRLKKALTYTDEEQLQFAFQNLKSFFKYQGILVIVVISIYILAIFFMIIAGIAGIAAGISSLF